MSISKEDLKNALNARLKRKESNIDAIINTVLMDLTIDIPALQKTISFDTIAEIGHYDRSSDDIRHIAQLTVDGTPIDPLTFNEYTVRLDAEQELAYKEPTRYCHHEDTIYLSNTPDTEYPIVVTASAFGISATAIDLPNHYSETLKHKVCAQYWIEKGQVKKAAPYLILYDLGLGKLAELRIKNLPKKRQYVGY